MELKKLFQVLVVGGAMIGGATACDTTRPASGSSDKQGAAEKDPKDQEKDAKKEAAKASG